MSDTVSRTVKSIEVKASTNNSGNLLINKMTMQQNLEPQQGAVIPITYYDYNYDLGQYDLGWNWDGSLIEDGFVPMVDINSPSGFKFGLPTGITGELYMQISIMGPVVDAIVSEIVQYVRTGSCSISVGVNVGDTLVKDQVLEASVSGASGDCEDAIIQLRCV
jgi:hypothetical protein